MTTKSPTSSSSSYRQDGTSKVMFVSWTFVTVCLLVVGLKILLPSFLTPEEGRNPFSSTPTMMFLLGSLLYIGVFYVCFLQLDFEYHTTYMKMAILRTHFP